MHTKNALIDVSSLRGNPAFARLWFGTTVSAMGGQLSSYAVLLQSWCCSSASGSSLDRSR